MEIPRHFTQSTPNAEQSITVNHGDVFGFPEQNVNPYCGETLFGFPVKSETMEKAAARLKVLRKSAAPRLTVRALADALGMPLGSYARYESVHDYKKEFLPLDLTRKIAGVLAERGVPVLEVMKLAGLVDEEAEPEGRAIEATRPHTQVAYMPVMLPSEAALADMFRGLLAIVPDGASKDETAKILARRLPTGFAAIGFPAPGLVTARLPAADADPLSLAKSHPED